MEAKLQSLMSTNNCFDDKSIREWFGHRLSDEISWVVDTLCCAEISTFLYSEEQQWKVNLLEYCTIGKNSTWVFPFYCTSTPLHFREKQLSWQMKILHKTFLHYILCNSPKDVTLCSYRVPPLIGSLQPLDFATEQETQIRVIRSCFHSQPTEYNLFSDE